MSASDVMAELAGGAFCRLSQFAVSRASGDDARVFLNGQLSSDVKTLPAGRWQLSSYSTPKGRALATFVLANDPTECVEIGFWLITRRSVAELTFKRLAMFVMRSKVAWAHDTHAAFGVCGTGGRELLATWLGCEPPAEGACVVATLDTVGLDADATAADCRVLGLGGAAWWLLVPLAQADALAGRLAHCLPERSSADWDAVEVAAGRPWVESETREAFVPQMLNLDLTGGISFKKGCYPGQEIVARTQYLGKVKRRMLRFAVDGVAASVAAGTSVFAAADADQALGQVVLAAPGDAGSQQLLAVLQMDLAAGADLRLAEASGPALHPLPLPYPLD